MIYGSGKFTYELVEGWAQLPEQETFLDVPSIKIDSKGKLHLFARGKHPVMVFDVNGNYLSGWGEGLFNKLHGGCLGPDDSVYITDQGSHIVSKFGSDGRPLFRMGSKDHPSDTGFNAKPWPGASLDDAVDTIQRGAPPFNNPTNASIARSGEIFVADGYGNARVHVFTPEGKLKYSWGQPGRGQGQFRIPHGIFIDKYGRVWVADRQNNRIQIFDTNGKFLEQWIDFNLPCDIFIDNEETVYVAELSRRVSILDKNGKLLARLGDQEQDKEKAVLVAPHCLVVDSDGNIYVGEVSMSYAKIDRKGRVVQKFARA
jgi:DNA-binding beta-propeller fold protein YncE